MATLATSAEVLATLAETLLATDDRRIAFEAASSADRDLLVERATADLDAQRYRGRRASDDRGVPFPRLDKATGQYIEPDESGTAYTVALVPRRVRQAHAIQSAALALLGAGIGNAGRLAQEAHRGVVSASSGGRSEAIDARRANSAAARLDVDAYNLIRNYLATGGDVV